jgi:hypothetical protein
MNIIGNVDPENMASKVIGKVWLQKLHYCNNRWYAYRKPNSGKKSLKHNTVRSFMKIVAFAFLPLFYAFLSKRILDRIVPLHRSIKLLIACLALLSK